MSSWDDKMIEEGLEQALAQMAQTINHNLAEKIKEIVCRNFELGRVRRFFQENSSPSPSKYVAKVYSFYQQYHSYLYALQVTHDPQTWQQLRQKLLNWRGRIYFHQQTHVEDIVQEACRKISNSIFPYDTDFDPWAYIIFRNTANSFYEPDAPNLIGYEEEIEPLLHKTDIHIKDLVQSPEEAMLSSENISELHQALTKLPEKQQQFIELYYIQEKSFADIAVILNVKINALYKLHFDALANLRKILKN